MKRKTKLLWIDTLKAVGFIVLIIGIVVGIVGFALLITRTACHNYGDQTGIEVEWRPLGGCFVFYEGQWMHTDQIRLVEITP